MPRIVIVVIAGIGIGIGIALAACGSSTGAQPAQNTRVEAAVTAEAWLNALKTRDVRQLAEKTQFPFVYKTTNRNPVCEGAAANAKMLESIVDCMNRVDKELFEELENSAKFEARALEAAKLPPWAAKLMGQPASGERLATAFVNGDGITFEFIVVVGKAASGSGAVRSLMVNSDVESQ